jgi:hypothetical protein
MNSYEENYRMLKKLLPPSPGTLTPPGEANQAPALPPSGFVKGIKTDDKKGTYK